jgi:hypothetical protein
LSQLSEFQINIKLKLSALWGSVMSLYIYCDYFDLYVPNKIESMINGTTIFGAGDQNVLLGLSSIMLVTSLMICLSVLLPAKINRILNIVVGFIMTLMLGYISFLTGWFFYRMYAVVEAIMTLTIVWYAWNWPKENNV